MDMHELTEAEVRERLLRHVWAIVDHWDKETRVTGTRAKLEGLAFSILAALDGSALDLPAFIVAPDPHPDDREYHQQHEEDWFPENHTVEVKCDLSGSLHELFRKYDPADHE